MQEEEKKEPTYQEKGDKINSQIFRELMALDPEDREEAAINYLESQGAYQEQAQEMLENEEENVKATMEFNKGNNLQPGDEEEFRMMAWADMLARVTPDKETMYQVMKGGRKLLTDE
jgi:hypothetical protein